MTAKTGNRDVLDRLNVLETLGRLNRAGLPNRFEAIEKEISALRKEVTDLKKELTDAKDAPREYMIPCPLCDATTGNRITMKPSEWEEFTYGRSCYYCSTCYDHEAQRGVL